MSIQIHIIGIYIGNVSDNTQIEYTEPHLGCVSVSKEYDVRSKSNLSEDLSRDDERDISHRMGRKDSLEVYNISVNVVITLFYGGSRTPWKCTTSLSM